MQMKIVHIVSTFPPYKGGMGNSAAQFAGVLSDRYEVSVLTPKYGEIPPSGMTSCRVERLRGILRYGNAAWLPQLLWKLKSFDIIHLHYPFYGTHIETLMACSLWRKKLVLHYHMDSLAPGIKGLLFTFNRLVILPLLLIRADMIIASSRDYIAHSQVSQYYKSRPEKFRMIPYWVDGEKFRPLKGSSRGEVVVLFVGGLDRAHYFKGLEVLLRSFSEVVGKYPGNLELQVVGSGELLPYYQLLTQKLGVTDKVQFLGNVDDETLAVLYRKSSFLVLPSVNQGEAFGLVLIEAMASGKPVIASNLPGVRSVFSDGKEGFISRAGDVSDLSSKMLRLASDEPLREQMGLHARALALNTYEESIARHNLDALYQEVMRKQ